MTGLGKFQAKWERSSNGYTLSFETPSDTVGVLSLPLQGSKAETVIVVNGTPLSSEQEEVEGQYVLFEVNGGKYDVVVTKR
jgi:hypothetical protein